jgi:hypothetical protein
MQQQQLLLLLLEWVLAGIAQCRQACALLVMQKQQ